MSTQKIYGGMAAPTGTISWFSISEGALPPIDKTVHKTITVLVTNGKWIDFGCYMITGEWRNEGSEWLPTHWAFINYPA